MADFTDDQISSHLKAKNFIDANNKVLDPAGVRNEMQTFGVSTDRLNKALGTNWIDPGTAAPAPAPAPAAFTGYSNDDITNHLRSRGYVDGTGSVIDPMGIYREMQTYGVSPGQIDAALKLPSSTSANWIRDNITNPKPAAAPAPAPAASIMDRAAAAANSAVNPGGAAPMPVSRQGQAVQTQWDESMSAAGRLGTMLDDPNSSLMQRAAARGRLDAAGRGVANSTAGIQASQRAMIDAASPIAAADSAAYNQMAVANTQQGNAWNSADASLMENARQANLGATTQLTVAGMSADLESRKIDEQMRQFAQQFGLSVEQLELDKGRLSQQDRQFYDGLKLEKSKLDQQAAQFEKDWTNKFSLEAMASKNRIDLANIDASNKEKLMGIEAAYKKEIAGNETISNAWGTMMQEIGRIQNNPDLEADAKNTLINNSIGQFTAFTSFWKKATGGTVDVSDLLAIKTTALTSNNGGNNGGNGNNGEGHMMGSGGDGSGTIGDAATNADAANAAAAAGSAASSSATGVGTNAAGDAAGVGVGPM